jgi:hypothetical protein
MSAAKRDESELKPLLYHEFMSGMCNAPWDDDKCGKCGGIGLKPVWCCNGLECGCRGMPVDFVECDCGCTQPTEEQIRSWI